MDHTPSGRRTARATKATPLQRLSWLIPVLALLSAAGYMALTYATSEAGFPLDDAWIHQTYARNLAETSQLAYLPGQPSAGSTSPAWSYLLSVGYLMGIDPLLWAYALGGFCLAATAWLAYRLALRLTVSWQTATLMTGLFCAVEWHLVWAAVSGMETMLFTAMSLGLLEYFFAQMAERRVPDGPASLQTERVFVNAVGIGILAGLLILTRPEGLGLAALVLGMLAVYPPPSGSGAARSRMLTTALSVVCVGVVLTPYILFNLEQSGTLFPNTFYAKQTEYQVYLQALSLPQRLWQVVSPTLFGAQILLVPGFCYGAYLLARRRRWPMMLPLVWWLALLLVYAWRLPVNYQHGRYAIPTIPILIIYGVWGTARLLRPGSPSAIVRILSRAAPLSIGLLATAFWARGALAYANDVGFIQGEMVDVAHWVDQHTEPSDVIAVHDIGAVGYLTDRPLLDLAGLITPEVIPFMTDAEQLLDWMVQNETAYAVLFSDFSPTYAQLAADPRLEQVYCTGHEWTLSMRHQNLCVHRVTAGDQD